MTTHETNECHAYIAASGNEERVAAAYHFTSLLSGAQLPPRGTVRVREGTQPEVILKAIDDCIVIAIQNDFKFLTIHCGVDFIVKGFDPASVSGRNSCWQRSDGSGYAHKELFITIANLMREIEVVIVQGDRKSPEMRRAAKYAKQTRGSL